MAGEKPFEDNVPGRFYIDKSCINCGLCPNIAPNNFAEDDAATHSFAFAQPANETDPTFRSWPDSPAASSSSARPPPTH